jgi:PAS domain S-box-containing protein
MEKTQSYSLAATTSTIMLLAIFILLFISGGIENSGHIWIFSLPLYLLFLYGTKKGSLLTLILILVVVVLMVFPLRFFPYQEYSFLFLTRYIGAFALIFLVSFFFEYHRTKTNKIISKKNIELENTIIELKSTESTLRESERRFRELADLLPQPVFEADLNGKVTFLSRSGHEKSGYTKDDFIKGINALDLFIPEDQKRVRENTIKIYKQKKLEGIEYTVKRKNGSTFPVIIHQAPVVKDKRIVGSRGIIIDISNLKKAEQDKHNLEKKLIRSEKMEAVGQLAGGVAHDLNNVLSAIVSYPDLLLMNLSGNSKLKKPIQTIKDSGLKAAAIVQDLLALARRGVQPNEIINLNEIISEYLESPEYEKLSNLHPENRLMTNLDPGLFKMRGSSIHLSKMVMNLVSNAEESMPHGGSITISTFNKYIEQPVKAFEGLITEGEYVVLKISDSGIGIPTESLKKIFEPFYTRKEMGRSGTGLGMAVVQGTVADHHGNMIISSEKNKGTTFEFYFPVTREKFTTKKFSMKLKDYLGKGEKILVIDDINEQREIASMLLNKLGYSVETAASGEEAIQYIKKGSADLLLLDMIMVPGIDGLETFEEIKRIKPDIKAVITSGFSETKRVKDAQKMGAGTFLKKPYTLENIGIAVKVELERK